MEVELAIIAAGGSGKRLVRSGIAVPVSKSFLNMGGRPVLEVVAQSLRWCGVQQAIVCVDRSSMVAGASAALVRGGFSIDSFEVVVDPGLGVHGLPTLVWPRVVKRRRTTNPVLLVAGHAPVRVVDVLNLLGNFLGGAAFSTYSGAADPFTRTALPTGVKVVTAHGVYTDHRGIGASTKFVALPYLLDEAYARSAERQGFRIDRIVDDGLLRRVFVPAVGEIEADVAAEWQNALSSFNAMLLGATAIESVSAVPVENQGGGEVWRYPWGTFSQ